ncbi:MAG TPA: GDSL-type esterase/lipase family protein [Burkholderiaceae bacterium]|nr:GDSL-type esterase/lipase family protein [Burkholderiaceae bacterium]
MALRRRRYVALGDSMSISEYPNIDAASRYGRHFKDLGAAALLFRNDDELFPEFAGRDLKSRRVNFEFVDLATDGATLPTVMSQLGGIGDSAEIITLTVGGNDMLSVVCSAPSAANGIAAAIEKIADAYEALVSRIRAAAQEALLILNTVYDPSDGTGRLTGTNERLPIEHLPIFNDRVRGVAAATHGAVLADVHSHFLGHGMTAPAGSRWYWTESIIEPGITGASEIRRLWVDALERARVP